MQRKLVKKGNGTQAVPYDKQFCIQHSELSTWTKYAIACR